MKIRYPVITSITLFFVIVILNTAYANLNFELLYTLNAILGILWLANLGLIAYLILRNIFRAIKGAVTGMPQGGDYQTEARRACEKVTPRRKQDVTPPWEE